MNKISKIYTHLVEFFPKLICSFNDILILKNFPKYVCPSKQFEKLRLQNDFSEFE
jgi:hypothetical protein